MEKKFITFLSGIHMWTGADYSHMDTDIKTDFFPLCSFVFVTPVTWDRGYAVWHQNERMVWGERGNTRERVGKPSIHLPDELVDVIFTVSVVTTLHEMFEFACSPSTGGVGELEWPEEVGGLTKRGQQHEYN